MRVLQCCEDEREMI